MGLMLSVLAPCCLFVSVPTPWRVGVGVNLGPSFLHIPVPGGIEGLGWGSPVDDAVLTLKTRECFIGVVAFWFESWVYVGLVWCCQYWPPAFNMSSSPLLEGRKGWAGAPQWLLLSPRYRPGNALLVLWLSDLKLVLLWKQASFVSLKCDRTS